VHACMRSGCKPQSAVTPRQASQAVWACGACLQARCALHAAGLPNHQCARGHSAASTPVLQGLRKGGWLRAGLVACASVLSLKRINRPPRAQAAAPPTMAMMPSMKALQLSLGAARGLSSVASRGLGACAHACSLACSSRGSACGGA